MKISGSFITMLIIWLLGFTHFLGGPYGFFKVVFWLALLPFFISIFVLIFMVLKTRKFFSARGRSVFGGKSTYNSQNQETLHVEAEVKE